MIFANTNKEITIVYDSEDHIGRQILALAQAESFPIRGVDLAHVKLTSVHWSDLAKRLKIEIKDLINCESSDFLQRFKGVSEMGEQDWLTLLIQNPQILKAPIVLKGKSIAMMCNPQDILQFVK